MQIKNCSILFGEEKIQNGNNSSMKNSVKETEFTVADRFESNLA